MKNNKSFEDAFCITFLVMSFDIAISGAIIPLVGTYFGVTLMGQVAIILAIQALVGLCFYRIWKHKLRNRKAMRSFNLTPNYYTEVEAIGEIEDKIEEKIIMEELEADEYYNVKLYATIGREMGNVCVFAHTGYTDYFNPSSKVEKNFSEMLFIEELSIEEFLGRYKIIENGKVKCRERPSFKKK